VPRIPSLTASGSGIAQRELQKLQVSVTYLRDALALHGIWLSSADVVRGGEHVRLQDNVEFTEAKWSAIGGYHYTSSRKCSAI
jgi:hypothetical protein